MTGRIAASVGVVLFLLTGRASAQDLSSKYPAGDRLDSGYFKVIHRVKDRPDLVIGILKTGSPPDMLVKEKGMLDRLASVGVPVATILEIGTYEGKTAYVQRAFVTGDRASSWDKVRVQYLDETSLADVAKIEKALVAAKLDVIDGQFLVAEDGHVVLNDPLRIERLVGDRLAVKPVLDLIATRARQAIEDRKLHALLVSMPGAEDPALRPFFEKGHLFLTGDADGKKALREAVLRYLETGATTAAAREVAAAVRSGRLVLELEATSGSTITKNGVVVSHNQTFPKVAADLVREGAAALHEGKTAMESRVVGTARALELLRAKKAPAGIAVEPYVLLAEDPAALVRLVQIPFPAADDAERARLEGLAKGILERPRDRGFERGERAATPGMLGGVDRIVRERARTAVPERR